MLFKKLKKTSLGLYIDENGMTAVALSVDKKRQVQLKASHYFSNDSNDSLQTTALSDWMRDEQLEETSIYISFPLASATKKIFYFPNTLLATDIEFELKHNPQKYFYDLDSEYLFDFVEIKDEIHTSQTDGKIKILIYAIPHFVYQQKLNLLTRKKINTDLISCIELSEYALVRTVNYFSSYSELFCQKISIILIEKRHVNLIHIENQQVLSSDTVTILTETEKNNLIKMERIFLVCNSENNLSFFEKNSLLLSEEKIIRVNLNLYFNLPVEKIWLTALGLALRGVHV
jgi:hypothetical protein